MHPYTHALLASIPSAAASAEQLEAVVHEEPAGELDVEGCCYHPRCPLGDRARCREVDPALEPVGPEHAAACHFPQSQQSLVAETVAGGR
jgi:oligopeptide/dipeptide ABC transporter ATP-binding protein